MSSTQANLLAADVFISGGVLLAVLMILGLVLLTRGGTGAPGWPWRRTQAPWIATGAVAAAPPCACRRHRLGRTPVAGELKVRVVTNSCHASLDDQRVTD